MLCIRGMVKDGVQAAIAVSNDGCSGKDMTTGLLLDDSILGDITPAVHNAPMLQVSL